MEGSVFTVSCDIHRFFFSWLEAVFGGRNILFGHSGMTRETCGITFRSPVAESNAQSSLQQIAEHSGSPISVGLCW